MDMAWRQELGDPRWWIPLAVTVAGVVVGLLQWLGISPMTAATWFAPIFVWASLVAITYLGLRWNPTITGAVSVAVILGLVLYGVFWHAPPKVAAPAPPARPVTPSPSAAGPSSTSLTALQLMDLMAADAPDATALAQSQVGMSLQVHGNFLHVTIMPEGPTSEIWDTRPSRLAAHFMVVLEYHEEHPTFPKRWVRVYVEHGHEADVASIPNHAEVVAKGTIEKIGQKVLNMKDATILPIP